MYEKSVVVLLLTCVQYGLSIRCLECNSANNSMCLDPALYDKATVDKFLRTECRYGNQITPPEGKYAFFCRKIVQTILHKGTETEVRITRGCGWKRDHRNRPCYKADNDDHLETVCQCFTDDCNGADNTRLSYAILVLSAISFTAVRIIM